MGSRWPVAVTLLVAATPLNAAVQVEVAADRVSVEAQTAPVSEVLDRLAGATGMQVLYEGQAPRNPITVSIEGRTPVEAVLTVLEGLGLNFALITDASGARVETLLMSGAPSPTSAPAPAPRTTPQRRAPQPRTPRQPLNRSPSALEEEPPPVPDAVAPPPVPAPEIPSYPRSPFTPGLAAPALPGTTQAGPGTSNRRPQRNQRNQ